MNNTLTKLHTNMSLEEAVREFMGKTPLKGYPELEKLLGDAADPNSPCLQLAMTTTMIAPPGDVISTIALGKVLVEMGVIIGYLLFSPDVDPVPSHPVGLGRDN